VSPHKPKDFDQKRRRQQ